MNKNYINVKELVRMAAEKAEKKTQKEIMEAITLIDEAVKEQLAQATPDTKVEIKVLPCGVTLVSEYVDAHEARNPQTGETVAVPGKNRVKAKLGSVVREAANA